MTNEQDPCDWHAIAIELFELMRGERKELSEFAEIDMLDAELSAPWDGRSVDCAVCVGLPAVHFEYQVTQDEYVGFRTWEYLARYLEEQRERALDDEEGLGAEPVNPTPEERVARVRWLLQGAAEYQEDFGRSLCVLAGTLGDQSAFAVMENHDCWGGRDLSVIGAYPTAEAARAAIRSIGTHEIDSIGIDEIELLERI